jgi:hypothetical protein
LVDEEALGDGPYCFRHPDFAGRGGLGNALGLLQRFAPDGELGVKLWADAAGYNLTLAYGYPEDKGD